MMTLETTRPFAAVLPADWRGPNDPPGTRFRGEQTFELYGYWPRDVIEISTIEETPIENKIVEAVTSTAIVSPVEPKKATSTDPVFSLIKARILIEDCVGRRDDWTPDEISPYISELQTSLNSLRDSVAERAAFDRFLAREGLG